MSTHDLQSKTNDIPSAIFKEGNGALYEGEGKKGNGKKNGDLRGETKGEQEPSSSQSQLNN